MIYIILPSGLAASEIDMYIDDLPNDNIAFEKQDVSDYLRNNFFPDLPF